MINENLIFHEKEIEMNLLINLIVALKRNDTAKFQRIIGSIIQILSEHIVASNTKLKSMTILRKLTNYKNDS